MENTAEGYKTIRVLVADDHSLIRRSIRALLAKEKSMQVIAEAADGEETLALVQELHPDILLLDIALPCLNGFEVIARIDDDLTQILIVSMHERPSLMRQAMQRGARGYVAKSKLSENLVKAIQAISRGETYFTSIGIQPV